MRTSPLFLCLILFFTASVEAKNCVKFPSGTPTDCIGSPDVYDVGGNIGVGTNIPKAKLQVNGTLYLNGSGSGYFASPNGIQFDPNNASGSNLNPSMTMTTSYNVGIGTGNTTPAAPLHVLGTTFLSTAPNFGTPELSFDANGNFFPVIYTPSGSTDSILKIGASSDKNTNASAATMSIDVDTGNVGVGTEIPASLFYVNGQTQTKTFKMATGASAGYVLTSSSVGLGTWMPAAAGGGGSGTVSSGTVNQEAVYTGSTTVGSGIITDTASNVGISSAIPIQKLDVAGTIRATQMVDIGVTASKVVVTDSNKQFTAATNLTDTAYSTAVGANPTATVGTAAVNGSSANFMRADGAPAINLTMSPTWTGNHIFAPSSGNTTITAGNVGINSATPGQRLDVQGTIRGVRLAVSGSDQNFTSAAIDARDSTNASIFFVGNDGSVGIGTYNTIRTVDIMQSGAGVQPILDLRDYNNVNSDTRIDLMHAEGTVTSPVAVADGDYLGGLGFWGYANGNFRQGGLFECRVEGTPSGSTIPTFCHVMTTNLASGEREVIKINPDGNLGIGSGSPGQILDAAGTVRATGFTLSGNGATAGFILQSNGSLGVGTWVPSPTGGGGSGTVNSGTANQVAYYASSTTAVSGSSALIITGASSGNNVGVGSATPGSLLDVQGTMRVLGAGSAISIGSTNPNGYLDVEGTLSSVVFFGVSAGSTAKNVGIGSYTPGQMLDVAGAGRFLGAGNTQLNTTSGNVGIGTTLSLNKLDVAGAVSIGTTYAGYSTAVANGMIIQGNVGINSTNPGQFLDVKGTIRMLGLTSFTGNNIKASLKAAANQACNTTCTSGGCLMGEDTSVLGSFVDCADATADRCICLDGAGG